MRHLIFSLTVSACVVHVVPAFALEPLHVAGDESSFGTTPAKSAAPMAPSPIHDDAALEAFPEARGSERRASEPPLDWAVLHAGLRPRLGTFGGIGTFAIAHARTERFYGGLSFSAVRNDAGTHVGLMQFALGRNLADTFVGGIQLSPTENRGRNFSGIGQFAVAYNRSLDMMAWPRSRATTAPRRSPASPSSASTIGATRASPAWASSAS